jgi:hypothetical protein
LKVGEGFRWKASAQDFSLVPVLKHESSYSRPAFPAPIPAFFIRFGFGEGIWGADIEQLGVIIEEVDHSRKRNSLKHPHGRRSGEEVEVLEFGGKLIEEGRWFIFFRKRKCSEEGCKFWESATKFDGNLVSPALF